MTLRPLAPSDAALLREATFGNVNWTGEARVSRAAFEASPELLRYAAFDPTRGDFGFVAEGDVGVVWVLFLDARAPGYGFVEDGVPELAIHVERAHRARGLGVALLHRVIEEGRRRGLERLSLSVEADNPAVRLYRKVGFAPFDTARGIHVLSLVRDGVGKV